MFKYGDCSSEEERLAVNQEAEISKFSFHPNVNKWKKKLSKMFIDFTEFKEPDLNNRATSLAVLGHDKLFKKLKLIGSK